MITAVIVVVVSVTFFFFIKDLITYFNEMINCINHE